jgi:hypothetical protein
MSYAPSGSNRNKPTNQTTIVRLDLFYLSMQKNEGSKRQEDTILQAFTGTGLFDLNLCRYLTASMLFSKNIA